jgi:uroporphyrinogen-III decarboxylase
MTSRERILAALEHRKPDMVPVDFGGTAVSGISASMVYKLRKAFKLPEHPIKVIESYQMLGEVEEDLLEKLSSDCVPMIPYNSMFGFRNGGWKPWTLFDGTPVLVPQGFNTKPAANGGVYQYPQGDQSVPPSAFLPQNGYYFDALIRQGPFDEDNPRVEDNLEDFTLLSDEELRFLGDQAKSLRGTGRAVIGGFGGTSLGDIALVPGIFMKNPRGIRDIEEWYISMAARQDFLKELYDRQTQLALENFKLFHEAVGDNIDIFYLCGTDFGSQNGPMCSAEVLKEVYLPYYRRMTGWIHQNTKWKTFKHCCGSIKPLIPILIEAGIDILNPVQNSAAGMDPQMLKDEFGEKLVFWGGGVDTQHTLPFGTPQEVCHEVTRRIEIYNRDGGFVFTPIHNTQSKVPVENFLAMIEGLKKYR